MFVLSNIQLHGGGRATSIDIRAVLRKVVEFSAFHLYFSEMLLSHQFKGASCPVFRIILVLYQMCVQCG